jgi:aryl-alcohol dehydrogenase-like predicted oxidoreductase
MQEEREMMPTLQHFGVGCIPWSPLAGGGMFRLAHKVAYANALPALTRPLEKTPDSERHQANASAASQLPASSKAIIDKVESIAKTHNVSMAQVALAWSLSKPFITAPIVGTTSLEKMDDLIKGCDLILSPEEIKSIDDLYEPGKIQGHS